MGFAKPIEQYLFGNLLTKMHVFMYLKDIIRDKEVYVLDVHLLNLYRHVFERNCQC